MTAAQKTKVGKLLILAAVTLVVLGVFLWRQESDDVRQERFTSAFIADTLDRAPEEVSADRLAPLAAWAVAGLAAVSGVIFLASTPTKEATTSPMA
jgi:hypothetical protein